MASAKKSRQRLSPTSRMTDFETSVLEMRNSLMHIIEASTGEKKQQNHRLVCIAKMSPGQSPAGVREHYSDLVKELAQEEVSGLLLIFPMHCIHVLEGNNESILEYLRDVRQQTNQETMFSRSKVLIVAHNITTCLFQSWMHHELDIQATGIGDYETTEPMENLVIDMVTNLIKIGLHLSKQPKLSYTTAVAALHERIPESLPQQDILDYFLEKDDAAIQSVSDFLRLYEEPYKVTLTGEQVWPMPDHLMPSFS